MALQRPAPATPADFREPALARFLFADARAGWVWFVVRVFLATQWLTAGYGKLVSPDWTGDRAGVGITAFLGASLAGPGGEHRVIEGWYATFLRNVVLPNAAVVGQFITAAELAIGLCLLVGAFTGIAAAVGIVMNSGYALAGSIGLDPLMILLEVLLVVAWRTAGWVGVDRRLLPALGTPWQRGPLLARHRRLPAMSPDTVIADQRQRYL
jgi:thiosulfate dehydrogenase (quinone) large subunit